MRTPTLLFTLACTLAACGDSSGGPVDSGLPAERKGSELSDAEATQLCEASADQLAEQIDVADLKNQVCVAAGISAALMGSGMVATCESVYDICMMMDYKPTEGGECTLGFELATCDATVAVIEDCFTEQNDATAATLKAASCDDLDKEPTTPKTGPACTTAKASCPGIA